MSALTSSQALFLRSEAHPYKPDFAYNDGEGYLPARGQSTTSAEDDHLPFL
ncbi:hypothetical protein [Kocuria sp. SM24M-10]|uniref:hypothetical protein n=1 Tax=Kocuria sp. SM24M-10 TaxID=1660349 RepID=UPI000AB22B21|nr:hypothetical protein [Kocuria sp. SM24M-10]